jgi:hypothetical protein
MAHLFGELASGAAPDDLRGGVGVRGRGAVSGLGSPASTQMIPVRIPKVVP